jgi:peptide-methionine (S)-S-oxide reductase
LNQKPVDVSFNNMWRQKKLALPSVDEALPGRDQAMVISGKHLVLGTNMQPPFPQSMQQSIFGLGCFWGAERKFWQLPGVYTTAVGYAGGLTPNPTYEEVCSGMTGHNEVVLVVFDPALISYSRLLQEFWEAHDPTQGMRQGNDVGTQYRSGIYFFDDTQRQQALLSREVYAAELVKKDFGMITTEVVDAPPFYYAEEYHQQYLARNPNGYCGLGGTGVCFPDSGKIDSVSD